MLFSFKYSNTLHPNIFISIVIAAIAAVPTSWGESLRATTTTTGIVAGLINPDLTTTKFSVGSVSIPADAYKVGFVSADAKLLRLNTTLANTNVSLLGVATGTGNFVLNSTINGILFGTGAPGSSGIGTERMRLTSTGRLGLGTSTPQNVLDVEGGAAIGSAYSGSNVSPSNGLLVQGQVGIKATTFGTTANLVLGTNYSINGEGGEIQFS